MSTSRLTLGLVAAAAALAGAGCASELPAPEIRAVTPAWSWNGQDTTVTVTGRNFYPAYSVVTRDRDAANLDAQFQVQLVGEETIDLQGAVLLDYQTLVVDVPSGLGVGLYDLVLTSPTGLSAAGPAPFEISDTLAYAMRFEMNEDTFLVNEAVQIAFQLVDPGGEPVDQALPVVLTAAAPNGAVTFTGVADLDDLSVDGSSLRGVLQPTGQGSAIVTAAAADDVWFTVGPQDASSTVAADSILVSFEPSEVATVDVALPAADFVATAGEPFDVVLTLRDAFGNRLPDVALDLALVEGCNLASLGPPAHIVGSGAIRVTVTAATGADCETNNISVLDSTASVSGTSAPFETRPAPMDAFEVSASADSVVAGAGGFVVRVRPVDAFGNTIEDYDDGMYFEDDVGGLNSKADPGAAACDAPFGGTGEVDCEVRLIRAADAITITVMDAVTGLITGEVGPIEVTPDLPAQLEVTPSVTGIDADSAYSVLIEVFDAYDNLAPITLGGDYDISAGDISGGTTCGSPISTDLGTFRASCASRVAGAQSITVDLLPLLGSLPALSGQATLNVVNGQLAQLQLLSSSASVVAGAPFELSVTALDAWDNPYLVQYTGAGVTMLDSTGTLSPSTLTLDASGLAADSFTVTQAGADVVIDAWHSGAQLDSLSLEVSAAGLDHLSVETERLYTWLDEPLAVQVSARDPWENVVPDYADPVVLVSASGGFADLTVASFVDGVASAELTWTEAVRQDLVTAEGLGGESGAAPRIDALDPDCADGPLAELTLNGLSAGAVTCLVGGVSAASASLYASAGGSAIAAYHVAVGDGASERLSADGSALSYPLEVDAAGAYVVELVALDLNACGSVVQSTWWVGTDDGSPAGPVEITFDDDSLVVGDAGAITGARLGVEDCSGDLAAVGGELLVRSDRAAISGATATGAGLVAAVSYPGLIELDLDASATDQGGEATLSAGLASGAAWGEASVTLTGDNARPYVIAVDPSGDATSQAAISTITATLNEPLFPTLTLIDGEHVSLDGPDGAVPISSLDHAAGVVTLGVDDLDPTAGEYVLTLEGSTVGASLVDTTGNRLDGEYSGLGSDFVVRFGTTTDEGLEVSDCEAAIERFTPDGDDGVDAEGDTLELLVTATAQPVYWLLSITDADDQVVRSWRYLASAASETLSWDGRDDGGAIVAAGPLTAWIQTLDLGDNLSADCAVQFELAQNFHGPE